MRRPLASVAQALVREACAGTLAPPDPTVVSHEFVLHCVPPKTNHQRKQIIRVGQWTRLGDRPELVAAKGLLDALLLPYVPDTPVMGPVRLELDFTWPWRRTDAMKVRARGRVPHEARPDLDNVTKTLADRLAVLRFIEDDAHIVDLHVRKWRGDRPGIRVRIEVVR